jgi:hypothetical protein
MARVATGDKSIILEVIVFMGCLLVCEPGSKINPRDKKNRAFLYEKSLKLWDLVEIACYSNWKTRNVIGQR